MRHAVRSRLACAAGPALLLAATLAYAAVELVDQDTKTVGSTTVTWDASFQDLAYRIGSEITLPVTWSVDAGSASFAGVRLRGPAFTPLGPDPAAGELLDVSLVQDTLLAASEAAVEVTLRFDELNCDEEREVQIGNAHVSLDLHIDEDGDGSLDAIVGYGVNVHVEQPDACAHTPGGPPPGVSSGPR